ncbi:MAG: PKD domain-containing protein [Actinobacteria bacterium]|nr:PKD domain-containing protein [Actinomycetota bacterium]
MLRDSVRSHDRARQTAPIATIALAVLTTAALAFAVLAMTAQSANAATYCVNAPSCTGTTAPSVGNAIAAASASGGDDRIEIGSGTYSDGPWTVNPGNTVRITGVGATKPVLTGTLGVGDGAVLTINAGGSTISGVEITIPSGTTGKTALQVGANSEITGLKVTGAGTTAATGVVVSSNNSSKIEGSEITLPWGAGNDSMAFLDFQRLKVSANRGVEFRNSSGTLSSSLLRYSAPLNAGYVYGIRINNLSGGAYTVHSANNTILGNGAAGSGVLSSLSLLGGTNTWAVNSNLIQGWTSSVTDEALAGGTNMNISYSRYDVVPPLGLLGGNALLAGNPGFVDEILSDFSLRRDSTLVDAGDPSAIVTAPQPQPAARDLAGNDRQVNAVGTDAAARDIGAYEVQNAAPSAEISVLTAEPQTGYSVNFSAANSSEPDGDEPTYLWTFDDGATASGPTASRLWQTPGIQTVQLKVTDSTGLSDIASVQIVLKKGSATVPLSTKATKIDRQGRFAYRLSCPEAATGTCAGRLTFKTAAKIDVKRFGARTSGTSKKIVKAGQYVFTLRPGETKTLRVRTYRTFIKLIKQKHKVKLRATLSGSSENLDLTADPADFVVRG